MLEKIIFNLVAVSLFIITFAKLIKKNDTSYINILIIQFIGIGVSFLELIFKWNFNIVIKIMVYLFSIVLPLAVVLIEQKKMSIPELVGIIKAKILLLQNKPEQAKQVLLKLGDKFPENYTIHKMLATCYEKNEDVETAIEEYVRAVELNLKDYDSYFKVAMLLNKTEKNDEAIVMLKDLLTKKPDYIEATNLLGDIYYNKDMFKEAICIYMEALKYNPQNYDLYYNLGMAYTRLNDFQRAKEYYRKAAELNSLLYNGIFNLGQIALLMSDLEEAERYFMQSLQGEDVEAGSYFYLAQIAMLKGEKDKALNYINVAIELDIEIYPKVKEQNLFIPIMKQIKTSYNQIKRMSKLTRKEIATQEHLYNMYNLVGSMNNIDMKMMKNLKINKQLAEKEQDEKIIE